MQRYLKRQSGKLKFLSQKVGLVLFALAILFAGQPQFIQKTYAATGIPLLINFQGKLTNVADGTNVVNGTYAIEFKLYNALTSGSLLWTETYDQAPVDPCQEVQVTSGIFNVKLGSCNPLTGVDFTDDSLYLSVNFDPGTGFDGEMSPRKRLVASPYAANANNLAGNGRIILSNNATTTDIATITGSATTTGDVLTLNNTSIATTSGDLLQGSHTATYTGSATVSGNLLDMSRSLTASGGGTTVTVNSPLARLTDNCAVASGGTCTHSGNVLALTQSFASASGAILNISGAGGGNLILADATNASANGVSIDIESDADTEYALQVTSDNGSIIGLRVDGEGNLHTDGNLTVDGGDISTTTNGLTLNSGNGTINLNNSQLLLSGTTLAERTNGDPDLRIAENHEDVNFANTGTFGIDGLGGGGDQCLRANNTGVIEVTGSDCSAGGSLQSSYNGGNTIETASNNAVIITETTASTNTGDLLQLTLNPATGGTTSGDALQITLDAADADGNSGHGIHMVIDQSQNTGNAILVTDDAAATIFQLTENGAMTLGAASAQTTAITITDTDYTNALSIADNNIIGTTFSLTGTTASIDFTDFDVDSDGKTTLAPDVGGDALAINFGGAADLQGIVIDAATNDSTATGGIIDLNVDSATDTASAQDILFRSTGTTSSATNRGMLITYDPEHSSNARTMRLLDLDVTGDSGSLADIITGLYIDVATGTNTSDTTYAAALLGGNVGIGTATPTQALDVRGNAYFRTTADASDSFLFEDDSGDELFRIDPTADLYAFSERVFISANDNAVSSGGTDQLLSLFGGTANNGAAISLYGNAHATDPNIIEFYRNGSTLSAIFDASGNLGIGGNGPTALLDVDRSNISSNSELIDLRSNGFTQTISSGVANARFNQFNQSTLTAGGAQTVTNAATVYIQGAPIAAGSATITNNYALWIDAGTTRLDGTLNLNSLAGGGNQCLRVDNSGNVGATGSDCGSGSGMAIGGTITSATEGSVLFAGASGVLAQDNSNFFWDDTNNRLGLGTATPTARLDVLHTNSTANTNALAQLITLTDSGNISSGSRTKQGLSVVNNASGSYNAGGNTTLLDGIHAAMTFSGTQNSGSDDLGIAGIRSTTTFSGTASNATDNVLLYGFQTIASGNMGTTANTAHYGLHAFVSGTARNNYGLFVSGVSGATNNYAAILNGGNVGIGITAPTSLLHAQQTADSTNTSTPVAFDINSVGASGELTASSGNQTFARFAPVVNQSGTAGYNALTVNSTQTAVGTGEKNLLDLQLGGASRATVASNGAITLQDASPLVTPYGGLGKFENHLTRSEEFDDDTAWIKTNVTDPSANGQTAPDGSNAAESLATTSSGGDFCQFSGTAAGSSTFTFSVWAKAASGTQNFGLRIDASNTSCATAGSDGTEQTFTATTTWKRYSVTRTFSAATGNAKVRIFPGTTGGTGTIYGWGTQLEINSTPSVYAKTTTAALTNDSSRGLIVNTNLRNTVASGSVNGGRYISTINSTQAGSHIGQLIRMIDTTSLSGSSQVVRGLEVQAFSGTNVQGVNTGIASFGYTFGVHAVSTGQANAVAQPAALFADLDNGSATTSGNAIRAYSDNATSADLVSIYQESSAYTGNALLFDLANNSGTFNSGNFISARAAGDSKFQVAFNGEVTLSLDGTAATGAICGSHGTGTTGDQADVLLRDCSGSPVPDYAEFYPTEDNVDFGDVVVIGPEVIETLAYDSHGNILPNAPKNIVNKLIKSTGAYQHGLVGIASNNYGDFTSTGHNLIDPDDHPLPIALSGRVPVKVTNENGEIRAGDYLTSSATVPGHAMRATHPGMVIGQALADHDGSGSVIVFVQTVYYDPTLSIAEDGTIQLQRGFSATEVTTATNDGAAYLIKQQGTGNILQLQQNETNRLLVASSGALAIHAEVADETELVLSITRADDDAFTINARGDVQVFGAITIKNDTFAGSVVSQPDGKAEVLFSYDLGTGKPVVQLTVESDIPTFAQVSSWIQDENNHYTGVVFATFDQTGEPIQSIVHYIITAKQENYETFSDTELVVRSEPYANGQRVTFSIPGVRSPQTQTQNPPAETTPDSDTPMMPDQTPEDQGQPETTPPDLEESLPGETAPETEPETPSVPESTP